MARPKKNKTVEPKGPEKTLKFTFEKQAKDDKLESSAAALTAALRGEPLGKSIKPNVVKKELKEKYASSKIVYNADEYANSVDSVDIKSWRRLSDTELKEISQIDPYISAMISTRASQGAIVGRPSDSKFDKGTRASEQNPLKLDDYNTKEEFKKAQEYREAQLDAILKWVLKCGTDDETILNSVFADSGDRTFKRCTFAEFLTAQIRNLMVFGRCGTHIVRNDDGLPVMFRPVAIETIYNLSQGKDAPIMNAEETVPESAEDAVNFNILPKDTRPPAYVQRIDGHNVNFFTEYDLKVSYFQKQAYFDLNGYPLSPIEQAIYMVFIHQQTLGYLRNQFLKGLATKGILNLESTEATAQLSDEDLAQLRREFHNFVNRNDNSAAIPVISGPVKVNFVPLNPSPQDMGFLEIEEHVIRALCSAFQISPQEMGYGNLSQGQGGLTASNKQEEIVRGEERGLRMLLDICYDLVNEIVFENFPEAEKLCRITYVGIGEDTRDTVIERHQQELNTTATLSSLWADSEKVDPVPYGGDVPLSSAFHANVVKYMKYGVFMEHFMGEEGASKNPAYDFIIDPNLNQAYQQLKVQPIQMQQEAAQLQLESQEMQIQQGEQQMQQGEQQMQMQEQQGQNEQMMAQQGAQAAAQPAPGAPQEMGKSEDEEQSPTLSDAWNERQSLRKSMSVYFGAWTDSHK